MRFALAILLLGVVGCASDDGYDTQARYYDNGIGYTDAEWRYEVQKREVDLHSSYHSSDPSYYNNRYYYDSYYYPGGSYGPYHHRSYKHRPDTSYRDDERDRVRQRDQQRDSKAGVRYPEDRAIERRERAPERIDLIDRPRDTVGDIDRSRDRDQQRERSRTESRSEPRPDPHVNRDDSRDRSRTEPRSEPRGDRNVRDVESARRAEPGRSRASGSDQSGDRVRRR